MTIPRLKFSTLAACLGKATQSDPGDFIQGWVDTMAKEEDQVEFVSGITALVDEIHMDGDNMGTTKLKSMTVCAIIYQCIKATIEGKELEEMFKETA